MELVIVLGFFVWENEVEGDLVALVNNGPMAGNHSADMKSEEARDGLEIFEGACDELVSGGGFIVFGPKNDKM